MLHCSTAFDFNVFSSGIKYDFHNNKYNAKLFHKSGKKVFVISLEKRTDGIIFIKETKYTG